MSPGASAPAAEEEIDLRKLFEALSRRRRLAILVLISSLVVGGGATAWQRAFRPTFQGSFKLLVSDPINREDNSGNNNQSGNLEQVAILGSGSTNTATLVQVLTSPLLLAPIEQSLGLAPGVLEGRIGVAASKGGRSAQSGNDGVLEVSLQWNEPDKGKQILEQVSRAYLNYSLRQRQEKLTQGLSFLDQQAPELQARVNRLQAQLSEFRRANGFVAPEQQAVATLTQRQALNDELLKLQQDQARLEARLQSVRRGEFNLNPASPTPIGVSPAVPGSVTAPTGPGSANEEPLEDLSQIEQDLAQAEANFTESSPQVQELRAKRDRLRPMLQLRLEREIAAERRQNLSQQSSILAQIQQLSKTFRANPDQIKQYEALQQQLDVARDNLSSYIKARENFRLQVAQRTVPWTVIDSPRFDPKPVKPTVSRNLVLSLLLGSAGGLAAALLRDRLDHVFHDPNELKQALPLPVLGLVPHLSGIKGDTINESLEKMDGSQKFEIRESLRNLFANFRLLRADKAVRLVAITSATQGEGKSVTCSLFANTLAQLGQRVLLVDADMRRPMLHRYIGAQNGDGLSSLLTDSSLEVTPLIHSIQPGLDLLSAGPMPPDTTRLLSSERCAQVLEAIRALPGYDLVLVDTPPALLLSDPVLMAEHLDGLLFVVGMSRVNRDLPLLALQRMKGTGVDVLGVLANLVAQPRKIAPYGYGYAYGYGYGYGYGYNRAGGYRDLASRYNPDTDQETSSKARYDSLRLPTKAKRKLGRSVRRIGRWFDERG
ncbi:MAG: GumC family protein [bacterium]